MSCCLSVYILSAKLLKRLNWICSSFKLGMQWEWEKNLIIFYMSLISFKMCIITTVLSTVPFTILMTLKERKKKKATYVQFIPRTNILVGIKEKINPGEIRPLMKLSLCQAAWNCLWYCGAKQGLLGNCSVCQKKHVVCVNYCSGDIKDLQDKLMQPRHYASLSVIVLTHFLYPKGEPHSFNQM